MSARIRPGEMLTYRTTEGERTGVVLDVAPRRQEHIGRAYGPSRYWVHRCDRRFELVERTRNRVEAYYVSLGTYTGGGERVR